MSGERTLVRPETLLIGPETSSIEQEGSARPGGPPTGNVSREGLHDIRGLSPIVDRETVFGRERSPSEEFAVAEGETMLHPVWPTAESSLGNTVLVILGDSHRARRSEFPCNRP